MVQVNALAQARGIGSVFSQRSIMEAAGIDFERELEQVARRCLGDALGRPYRTLN